MKKLVQINVVCNGSTGKIMCNLAKETKDSGFDSYCFYGRGLPNKGVRCIRIGNKLSVYFHVLLARLGFNGHGSYFATKKMVKKLREINPDVIHLHNIHGYYINLKVLFKYLKKEYTGKIVWTLHDCWSFTGHCSHFTVVGCNKWKTQCKNCPQLKCYPSEFFDTTSKEYKLKKNLFTNLDNLVLVTPSNWLKSLVKQSFFKNNKVMTINNGIDTNIFKPTYDDSIYDKYNIPRNKKIILGVANIWNEKKGLGDFVELSKLIDENYVIVLVGLLGKSDMMTINSITNIIHINRTENAIELAKIYTISNVFFNPTYEDNYPTTNLEAIACGTFVITYDTGGCGEQIYEKNGIVCKKNVSDALSNLINIKKNQNVGNIANLNVDMFSNYLDIYKS